MTEARSYSVTPRTMCIRHENGTRQVLLMTAPKNAEGIWGYLMCSSFRLEHNQFGWHRNWEHPQEWEENTDSE